MDLARLVAKPPLTVAPHQPVHQAALAMVQRGVGAATVMDGGRVVGVVTERDMLKKVVAANADPKTALVREVMTSPVLSVREQTSIASAGELMRKHHVRHLVVLDDKDQLVGMLSQRRVLYEIMDELDQKVGDLQGLLLTDGPGG